MSYCRTSSVGSDCYIFHDGYAVHVLVQNATQNKNKYDSFRRKYMDENGDWKVCDEESWNAFQATYVPFENKHAGSYEIFPSGIDAMKYCIMLRKDGVRIPKRVFREILDDVLSGEIN